MNCPKCGTELKPEAFLEIIADEVFFSYCPICDNFVQIIK